MPAFIQLEVGGVLAKKFRRNELTRDEGEVILKEFRQLPLQYHPDDRLSPTGYSLALATHQSLYDCLYLALAETIDGSVITADRKFFQALSMGPMALESFGLKISFDWNSVEGTAHCTYLNFIPGARRI